MPDNRKSTSCAGNNSCFVRSRTKESTEFLQEMTAAYNDMLDVKTSLGFCRHNYEFHVSPFIEFCSENYPTATEITKEMIDQWLVSKFFNTDNTRRIAIINIRHFTRYLNFILCASLTRKN